MGRCERITSDQIGASHVTGQHRSHEARWSKACLHPPTANRISVMDIKRAFAIGFKRRHQNLDIVAVISSIAVGCLVITITRLINGPDPWDWFGPVVGASISATGLAKQRERSRRNTDDRLGGQEPNREL
jgi:hypothetical protein